MENVLRKSLLCLGLTILTSLTFAQGSTISGTVFYHESTTPMDGVTAYLTDSTGTVIETTTTGSEGVFEFTDVPDGSYTITFSTTEAPGGVTLSDAFSVMLYLMGMEDFTPFQYAVADVNGDTTVFWDDYYEILFSYLTQGNPFPAGDWYFEPIEVPIGGNRDGVTTSGSSTGDVNGTFQPPKYGNCIIDDQIAQVLSSRLSQTVVLPLKANNPMEITGLHLVFNIPEELTFVTINSSLPDVRFYQEGDEVRVTWMNTAPHQMKVTSTLKTNPPDRKSSGPYPIEIATEYTILELVLTSNTTTLSGRKINLSLGSQSHFTDKNGDMLPFNLSLPGVTFDNDITINESCYPNPFVSHSTLEYDLPKEGNVKIMVTNSAGQVVDILVDEHQAEGLHKIEIEGSSWPSGVYHYAIIYEDSDSFLSTGSMIKFK